MATVLIVDDEQTIREFLGILLKKEGHHVVVAETIAQAQAMLKDREFDLVVTDLRLGDGSGMDLLKFIKQSRPETQVVMITAFATMENAIEAMKLGAYDYQLKPFKLTEIRLVISKALEKTALIKENRALKKQLSTRSSCDALLGKSPAMSQVFTLIEKVAKNKTNILVCGESGTGKELVARAIHNLSDRAQKAFVAVNCGAIPETLVESEFFGYKRGAFTGAATDREGLFEAAQGGTLFLDEIGELPQSMQVKLLRALQERVIKRLGDAESISVDVRVIAATNRDLEAEVKNSRFREDLFYRLNVIQIRLPPLRERREDIPILIEHLVQKLGKEQTKELKGFSPEAMKILLDYRFPGNVRELENILERAVALAEGPVMGTTVLPHSLTSETSIDTERISLPSEGFSLEKTLDAIEYKLLCEALERTGGKKKRAAEVLGLTFRSMRYRLQKHKLGTKDDEPLEDELITPAPEVIEKTS